MADEPSKLSNLYHVHRDRCGVCSYDVSGLPDRHRCPECGAEYDKTREVFITDARGLNSFSTIIFFSNYLLMGITFAWFGHRALSLFILILIPIAYFLRLMFSNKDIAFSLSSEGISVVGRKRELERCAWKSIFDVRWSSFFGVVIMRGVDGSVLARIWYDYFGGVKRAKQFVDAANQWQRRTRQQGGPRY